MTASILPSSLVQRRWRWKWLLLRRVSQLAVVGLFLLGPWAGIWIIKGNLAASRVLETVPLTDPFALLQTLSAGHLPESTALLGVAIVVLAYLLLGGRAYCSWVCPVNPVTDAAAWFRERLGIPAGARPPRSTRYWLLATVLAATALTGVLVWEWVNPVSLLHRGLIFGFGAGWTVLLAVFLFDLLITRRGWCGHLCPMGAGYSLIGAFSLLRVRADRREQCNDCMDCYRVCPEPSVITPALKGARQGKGPVILDLNCTNCGRCLDVCDPQVFRFGTRFRNSMEAAQ